MSVDRAEDGSVPDFWIEFKCLQLENQHLKGLLQIILDAQLLKGFLQDEITKIIEPTRNRKAPSSTEQLKPSASVRTSSTSPAPSLHHLPIDCKQTPSKSADDSEGTPNKSFDDEEIKEIATHYPQDTLGYLNSDAVIGNRHGPLLALKIAGKIGFVHTAVRMRRNIRETVELRKFYTRKTGVVMVAAVYECIQLIKQYAGISQQVKLQFVAANPDAIHHTRDNRKEVESFLDFLQSAEVSITYAQNGRLVLPYSALLSVEGPVGLHEIITPLIREILGRGIGEASAIAEAKLNCLPAPLYLIGDPVPALSNNCLSVVHSYEGGLAGTNIELYQQAFRLPVFELDKGGVNNRMVMAMADTSTLKESLNISFNALSSCLRCKKAFTVNELNGLATFAPQATRFFYPIETSRDLLLFQTLKMTIVTNYPTFHARGIVIKTDHHPLGQLARSQFAELGISFPKMMPLKMVAEFATLDGTSVLRQSNASYDGVLLQSESVHQVTPAPIDVWTSTMQEDPTHLFKFRGTRMYRIINEFGKAEVDLVLTATDAEPVMGVTYNYKLFDGTDAQINPSFVVDLIKRETNLDKLTREIVSYAHVDLIKRSETHHLGYSRAVLDDY